MIVGMLLGSCVALIGSGLVFLVLFLLPRGVHR